MSSSSSLVGVPHAVTKDDVYGGFFIPKGGSCFLNEICLMFANTGVPRRGGDRKYMVGLLCPSLLMEKLELSTGQFYKTLPAILNRMCSNRSGF